MKPSERIREILDKEYQSLAGLMGFAVRDYLDEEWEKKQPRKHKELTEKEEQDIILKIVKFWERISKE